MLEKSSKSVADQFAGQMIYFKSLPVSRGSETWDGDTGNMGWGHWNTGWEIGNMGWGHWEHGMETLRTWDGDIENMGWGHWEHGMGTLRTWDGNMGWGHWEHGMGL